jgi:hypothetical protein
MTVQTRFDVLIGGHGEQPTSPNFLDASELLVRLEFVNLELLDDESTISSCSTNDDSSIESSLGVDFVMPLNDEIELPLALSQRAREKRRWSSSSLSEDAMNEVVELDSLRLSRRRSKDGSRGCRAAEQSGGGDQTRRTMTRDRVHVLEEDSAHHTRTRLSANTTSGSSEHKKDYSDSEDDFF